MGVEFDSFYNGNSYEPTVSSDYNGSVHKRDHVAVVLNGESDNTAEHIASSFLYQNNYAEGFTDVGVNDRLFTAWIEFNGEDFFVRYAQGDFEEAIRPEEPQIWIKGSEDTRVKDKLLAYKDSDVKIGFSSAIGSSKANHTIHSVAYVNRYIENGIGSYTAKYYVEVPAGGAFDIEMPNGKRYKLDKEVPVTNAPVDRAVHIADLSDTASYGEGYTAVDYTGNGYPRTIAQIAVDGSTILYQFYDHGHKWEYTANGNEITGECISVAGDCDENVSGKKVTIVADDLEYTGNPYTPATLLQVTDDLTGTTGAIKTIYYEGVGDTQYAYSVAPPSAVGTYRAIVEINGVRAVKEFKILPAPKPQVDMEKDQSPKTGENNNSFEWLILMLGSGLAMLVTGKILSKKED